MKISELTLAELRLEHARHRRDVAEYQELTRARRERGDGPHPNLQKALGKAEEYAILLLLAEGHNEDEGPTGDGSVDLDEEVARQEVMDWLLRGVDGLDSVDAVAALDAYAALLRKPVSTGPDSYAE